MSRGSALLAVLWLSAALTAVAFAVAMQVRGEAGRTETALEGTKAHYLATGALARAAEYLNWGPAYRLPNGQPRFWENGIPLIRFAFPTGVAAVEVIPESSKLNVNRSPPQELGRLLLALGLQPEQAQAIAQAIVYWRAPSPPSALDFLQNQRPPTFRPPHASLEQIEELLGVQGITPELFYGGYERTPEGAVVRRPGLRDCLSIYSSGGPMDLNTVQPPVMLAAGAPLGVVQAISQQRRLFPITNATLPQVMQALGPAAGRFRLGGDRIFTLRATARLTLANGALSETRRTVAMVIETQSANSPENYRILGWQPQPSSAPLFDLWPR